MCTNLLILLSDFILLTGNIQQRLDLSVQLPPWPIAKEDVLTHVTLDNNNSQALVKQLLVHGTHQTTTDVGLERREDGGKLLVTIILKHTQDTSTEENLEGEREHNHGLKAGSFHKLRDRQTPTHVVDIEKSYSTL